jgi:hypothetical protein
MLRTSRQGGIMSFDASIAKDIQSVVHYMSHADFESPGDTTDPDRIPTWTKD